MEVLPHFWQFRSIDNEEPGGLLPTGNFRLRFGEVKKQILPTEKDSLYKLGREYEVLVDHYEGGSATHRIYHNCVVINLFAGLADKTSFSLRESEKKDYQFGKGSKVLLLCIEGNDARGVILGGLTQKKDTNQGHYFEWEFNGVNFQVFDDGSFKAIAKGKTDATGKTDNKDAGTYVKVEANGNLTVSTANGKNVLSIDNKAGTITINSDSKFKVQTSDATVQADKATVKASNISLDGSRVSVGSNAVSPAVLGDRLVQVLVQAFGIIAPTLPTPPQQAALAGAAGQLALILSKSVSVAN